MAGDSDVALPKALMDFIFDLYDSVTLSQMPEEQTALYAVDFKDLSSKYFANQQWPSPQSIAAECNGDPLFLAVYREMTHRHWHAVSRPTIRDRMDGWQVYRELFDELLEAAEDANFFLLPQWVFDILHEFGYQFQGFCQVRSAVYASARKHSLINEDGTVNASAADHQQSNLADNLQILESNPDAWDVELVFDYLHRFGQLGLPGASMGGLPPVYSYFNIFAVITQSRLECLLGDFYSSLQALTPLTVHADFKIPKNELPATVTETLNSVFAAKLSVAYHTGVSLLMLRRHKDAVKVLGDICATMLRGFKTGQLRKLPGSDQFNKQFERMLALLALLQFICPTDGILEDAVVRSIREKHATRLEAANSYEEWFQSPKFVSTDPKLPSTHRHMVQQFGKELEPTTANRNMRSYLKLYSAVAVPKLATFYDLAKPDQVLPLLWSFKVRNRQLERGSNESISPEQGTLWKDSLDIHYYMVRDTVYVDEAEKQRRFENFFYTRIEQNHDILKTVLAIDTHV